MVASLCGATILATITGNRAFGLLNSPGWLIHGPVIAFPQWPVSSMQLINFLGVAYALGRSTRPFLHSGNPYPESSSHHAPDGVFGEVLQARQRVVVSGTPSRQRVRGPYSGS